MNESFPPIPKELIEALEKRFPERTPDLRMNIHEIRHKGGEQSVVRFLRAEFDRQNEDPLSSKVL